MAIQREVGSVNGEVAVEGSFYFACVGSGQWRWWGPVEAVMADEEVDVLGNRELEGDLSRVDSGSDSFDGAVVLQLETVMSAVEVFYFGAARALITKSDDVLKFCHRR
tara:strand:+ start:537 stop:860 length:324 start_codon:yes stop_codon:yes gene_type:complete